MKTSTSISTSSSSKSGTTEDRCYFPGCRKDANCNCEICLESINATLDLMPMSVQKSTLTKYSASSNPFAERTPILFKASILSTPTKGFSQISESPLLKSTAKSNLFEEKETETRKRSWDLGAKFWRVLVALSVVFAIDSGFTWLVLGVFRPTLSPEIVRNVGEKAWVYDNLNPKLQFLQKELEGVVHGKLSNCSSVDSVWRLNQDGLLMSSRCTLYKSIAEEVSIWGWPLQNTGLIVGGFSTRSLTTLSGKVTEWPNGRAGFSFPRTNSSWILGRLSASVVQMDPDTWFLEYVQTPMIGHSRLSLAAAEFLKFWIARLGEELKSLLFWLHDIQQYNFHINNNSICPT